MNRKMISSEMRTLSWTGAGHLGTSSDGKVKVHRTYALDEPVDHQTNARTAFSRAGSPSETEDELSDHFDVQHQSRDAKAHSQRHQTHRKHRSLSSPRTLFVMPAKPKKSRKYLGSASASLTSIPNAIKLSMLNSGLLSMADEATAMAAVVGKPVELAHYVKHCEQRRKYPVLFRVEFQTACKVEGHSTRHGSKTENRPKNQNQKIIPYDYNRVVLEPLPGSPDSDYINASYVDSLLKPNAYVVTQGPNERTIGDFWRLVWQVKASCIVMLTKTFDFIKVMCVQYWPAAKGVAEVYGGIEVCLVQEEPLANFIIRHFRIKKEGSNEESRKLLQFHYTEWPSHSCPYSNAIMEFRRRVRAALSSNPAITGPMVVHCNDGAGRSGVFLAIDANLESSEEDGVFDVFGYLKKLRQSRRGLVESLEQYKFIYDTLEEYVHCGLSWFPVSELSMRLKQKSVRCVASKMNEYQKEYQRIFKQTPRFTIGDCAGGHRADNREKNRDVLIVPPDNFRPYLTSFQGNNFTDYINAVFVDGYTRPKEYIITEWPLSSTLGDLWSLVYDYECSAVVVLSNPAISSTHPSFWPETRRSMKYGPVFTVDHVSHNHYPNIKSWIFRINKKEIAPHRRTLAAVVDETRKIKQKIVSLTELMAGVKAQPKTCQLFQLTCWPEGHKVPTSTNSLVELMNMVERWRQRTEYGPVVVVSLNGRSRVGVYCAANACIEQVIQHGEVDVFQAVKNVRRHRPQLVENLTEYKYCYDLVLHYVLHYLHKDAKKGTVVA